MHKHPIKELALADQQADLHIESQIESSHRLLKLLIAIYGQKQLAIQLNALGLNISREALNK